MDGEGEGGGPRGDPDGASGGDVAAELVSKMAHQLKNPMQAVAMNVEVLRTRLSGDAPALWEELEGYAAAVERGVRQLDRRLGLLTALGRRDPEETPESVSLGSTVAELVDALRYDREPPAVAVEREEEGFEVRARLGYLVEILYRLLAAARSRASSGRVSVSVEAGVDGEGALTISLPGAEAVPVGDEEGGRWRRLTERAGGRLDAAVEGPVLARLTFPVA